MIRTPISILLLSLLATGCAPGATLQKDSSKGYCFQAEGLSKERCYTEYATCLSRESSLRDHYPFAPIQSECQRDSRGALTASNFARTMAEGQSSMLRVSQAE